MSFWTFKQGRLGAGHLYAIVVFTKLISFDPSNHQGVSACRTVSYMMTVVVY